MGGCATSTPAEKTPIIGDNEYTFVPLENRVEDISEYFTESMVMGTGASCRVLKAIKKKGENQGEAYAMKEMVRDDEWNPKLFQTEHDILTKLNHPNILQYRDAWIDRKNFYVLNELCTGGELFEKIHDQKKFNEKEAAKILIDIISAIKFCHDADVVHRDLKPENIVYRVTKSGKQELVIIDFGDAKIVDDNEQYNEFVGTAFYLPPEIIRSRYGWELKASDLWSIGIISYVLMTGRPPFHGKSHKEILKNILKQDLKFPRRSKLGPEAKSFIRALCEKKTKKRKTAEEALAHAFLGGKASSTPLGPEFLERLASYHRACLLKRVLVKLGADLLSDKRKAVIDEAFKIMDKNGDGYVDKKELTSALANWGMHSDTAFKCADTIISEIGTAKHKRVNKQGFKEGAVSFDLSATSKIKQTFKQMSGDKDYVDKAALNTYFHDRVEDDSLRQMLEEIDQTKNGKITYEEFEAAMNSPLKCAPELSSLQKKRKK